MDVAVLVNQELTYKRSLWMDTGCSQEDLQAVINDRDEWRERVRKIQASSGT